MDKTMLPAVIGILAGVVPFVVVLLVKRWYFRPYESRTVAESLAWGRFVMECVISLTLMCAGLYVIVADKGTADTQKWATGIVGLVLGYWLKSGTNSTPELKSGEEVEKKRLEQ